MGTQVAARFGEMLNRQTIPRQQFEYSRIRIAERFEKGSKRLQISRQSESQ